MDKEGEGTLIASKAEKVGSLDVRTPALVEEDIHKAKDEITQERTAKMVGLICHLAYWSVFGNLNKLPLDSYHIKQLFISIAQI